MADITNPELNALLALTDERKRDAWASFGSITLTGTIRHISKGTIFVLDDNTSTLDGYTMYCSGDIEETVDIPWDEYTLNDATDGTIIRNTIVHPYLFAIQSETDRNAVGGVPDTTFNPFENVYAVDISDNDLEKIMVDIGFPFLNWDDLEFTKAEVLKNMVLPAMEEFFKYFPKVRSESYNVVQARFDFPVPAWALRPVRAWITPGYPGGSIGNPIIYYFDEVLLAINARGSFMQPQNNFMAPQKFVDLFGYNTYLLDRAVRQGIANHSSRVRIRVRHNAEDNSLHLIGFSSKLGLLHVDWAIPTILWDDIPVNRRTEVRDLAKANIMRALGMLRTQVRNDAIGTIDPTTFLQKASELETRILEQWKNYPRPVVIRGT